ncbi:nucleoredoxin 3 [Pyrus ussuriensis x Pyrus communis]|uniref:Nucleoredoxin 3 n=1 Tax=Pyrus ussuriensis x Pyrus communis TaxID=2448454 RepID=A0A5N5GUA8_9ROSA|nr:nucleoredoxin 3 [Pyrus ussuriensis x Pyrus communis]
MSHFLFVTVAILMSDMYRIDRILSLISLRSDGISIEEDLVGLIEDNGADLRAADEAKHEGGKLEELLTHQGRNHVLSSDGRELMSSSDQDFEIILVSTDRGLKEFDSTRVACHGLPYPTRTKQVIPALVLIGPDGRAISTNGKAMISLHGAKAFPFTESRIKKLEAALRNEGEALPPQVKDLKHEHMLKLEMAKAYVLGISCGVCDYDLHPNCVEKSL